MNLKNVRVTGGKFMFAILILCTKITRHGAEATTWRWKHTLDADSPDNYVASESTKSCHGFYFPEFKDICMMSLEKLRTNQIFLPETGDIYLKEGADIVFDPEIKQCVRVKPTSYKEYLDPNSWVSEISGNRAVPHLERSPCQCDDVFFPNNSLYAVSFPTFYYTVRNIDYGLVLSDNSCPEILWSAGEIYATSVYCKGSKPCKSSFYDQGIMDELCPLVGNEINRSDRLRCTEAVQLIGHCAAFCGVVIHIADNLYIDVDELLRGFLPDDDIFDVYRSKVVKAVYPQETLLQISITDKKGYTGNSALRFTENRDKIIALAKSMGVLDVKIYTSGPPNDESGAAHGFLFVLGTLAFVLLLFGVIYGIFEKNAFNFNYNLLPQRFNLSRYNQALRRSVIFSRFDNTENVSIAGSVLSLEREGGFSNPLFGETPAAGTSKGAEPTEDSDAEDETVAEDEGAVENVATTAFEGEE